MADVYAALLALLLGLIVLGALAGFLWNTRALVRHRPARPDSPASRHA